MSDDVDLAGLPVPTQPVHESPETPCPMLCFSHGGSPRADEHNLRHGFSCSKCAELYAPGVVSDPTPPPAEPLEEESISYDRVRAYDEIRRVLENHAEMSQAILASPRHTRQQHALALACQAAAIDHSAKVILDIFTHHLVHPTKRQPKDAQ